MRNACASCHYRIFAKASKMDSVIPLIEDINQDGVMQ